MNVFAESLEGIREREGLAKPQFHLTNPGLLEEGKLISHLSKSLGKGSIFNTFYSVCVWMTALSQLNCIHKWRKVYNSYSSIFIFGLEMHIG